MYSWGDFGSGKFYAINVMTLDDIDPNELTVAELTQQSHARAKAESA